MFVQSNHTNTFPFTTHSDMKIHWYNSEVRNVILISVWPMPLLNLFTTYTNVFLIIQNLVQSRLTLQLGLPVLNSLRSGFPITPVLTFFMNLGNLGNLTDELNEKKSFIISHLCFSSLYCLILCCTSLSTWTQEFPNCAGMWMRRAF